jgi:folate-binding protein YgfZ
MQPSISEQIATLRSQGGYFCASDYGLIEIYGKDAAKFLQDKTTNDVLQLKEHQGQLSCLLDRKAHVKAFFQLYRKHESFRIIAEKSQIEPILAHLEQYKFSDKVEFLNLCDTGTFFALQGPNVFQLLSKHQTCKGSIDQDLADTKLWGTSIHLFRKSVTGEEGYFIWVSQSDVSAFFANAEAACLDSGFSKLTKESLETARIEAGLPKFATDFLDSNLLPETGLEELTVSYSKGCFLGQEVLARIKNHGAATKALMGLVFAQEFSQPLHFDSQVLLEDKEIAQLKSNCYSPTLNKHIAIALVRREYRVPNRQLNVLVIDKPAQVSTTLLPFYHSASKAERALKLYQKALSIFALQSGLETEIEAIKLLESAIVLEPLFEDAYESLGVILSKCNRLDEAIAIMKRLAELNPQSIMAHTNLSVFYIAQGLKEQAEEEKAISMSIRMQLAAKEAASAKQENKDKIEKQNSANERLDMFRQVLAIDSEDLLANYGSGSCLIDLEQYAEAIPYLAKAIEIKPTHSVAYLALATAYQSLGKTHEAGKTLERGIEIAAQRADMEPLKQMQNNLAALIT